MALTNQITFPLSALEIMQACLEHFKKNSESAESAAIAAQYLETINSIISGEVEQINSADFFELHKFIITIYSGMLEKGQVTEGKWTSKQWENVLKYIQSYYSSKVDTYEVSLRK